MSAFVMHIFQDFRPSYTAFLVLILGVLYFIINFIYKRQQLSKKLPGLKVGLLDFLGDAGKFQVTPPEEYSKCPYIYILQIFYAYYELFKKESIFTFWFGYTPTVFITKARTVEELIGGTKNMEKDWSYNFAHRWLNTGLLTSHGQKWKTRRKLITPSFHFDILKEFLPVIDEQSKYLVNEVFRKDINKDWIDVTMPLTLCTLDIICQTTMGVNVNAQKNAESEYIQALMRVSLIMINRMSNPAYSIDAIFNMSKMGRQFEKDVNILHDFTRKVIKEKKSAWLSTQTATSQLKRKALMDMLLEQHLQNKTLSEEDIREEVDTFTFAGHDTTSMGISWALYLIGLHKDVQNRLHEEIDRIFGDDTERPVAPEDLKDMEYLERVLKECQRIYPSVPMFGRKATKGTILDGYEIPEGTACYVFTYALHRDPDEFPDPEKFDPDRFLPENTANRHPYAYLPFSAGPRNCIGQRFAMLEEKAIIANILRNFTWESVEPRDKINPVIELVMRNSTPLKIKFRERIR